MAEANQTSASSRKPKLLYVLHCYHNRAGTEQHTKTLAAALSHDFEISFAFPEDGLIHLLRENKPPVPLPAAAVPWPLAPYRSPIIEQSVAKILELAEPDLIHVQHFYNWPLGLLEQLSASGKPVVISYHDYYSLTPHYTLESSSVRETVSPAYSKRLFRTDISTYLMQRRRILERSLSKLSTHVVPSPFLARQLEQVFPLNYTVIEHGIPAFEVPREASTKRPLTFGFVGSLLPQKGWVSLLNGFSELAGEKLPVKLEVFGGTIQNCMIEGVTFHGIYEQSDLPSILSRIDVGVIPSIFPETYSLVLSELWQGGLPAAVSDLGALGDRVVDGVNGKKFKPGDTTSIASALRWFLTNDSWRSWKIPEPRHVAEMVEDYRKLYNNLLNSGR